MKSFNSFEQIFRSFELPERWLPDSEKYWAHLPSAMNAEAKPETLQEHISLVNRYALVLIEVHGLDEVVDALIKDLLEKYERDEEVGAYLKEMFASAIHFHDYGKVNPNFQYERMQNRNFPPDKGVLIGTEHSRLSTYLYLQYHFAKIQSSFADEEAQTFLWVFAFLLSNPITRHHSSTIDHNVNLDENHLEALGQFLELLDLKEESNEANKLIKDWKDLFRCFHDGWQKGTSQHFSEVALVKLCFSLLTAADFCATFEYMNQLELSDWGVLSDADKQRYVEAFRSRKLYNKVLFQRLDHYRDLPFEELQKRNTDNLNQLRQKLAAQAISNLRNHRADCLFFLEAPTGGGKTNISIALALELLQSDSRLNKIFYVFPFTTLVTQTYENIQDTLGLGPDEVVELHSRAGFSEKEAKQDGVYGSEKQNYIANLFANYPVTLMTHVRFFDILKSNRKEINYLLHRMANSVVIIDELQAYSPAHWDKIVFLLSEYARLFNMRVIMMSATLPYIDELLPPSSKMKGKVRRLVPNRDQFFLNPNFGKRVEFSFELMDRFRPKEEERAEFLEGLAETLIEKSEAYARAHEGSVRTIIEFVKKKTAGEFFRKLNPLAREKGYDVFLISGEILEPRRRQIIRKLKENSGGSKVILVSTQVVEAGVDIDMDIGFKDVSVPDSEEQLAGRVNRNAAKSGNVVYLFDLDMKSNVYGKDLRYKSMMEWNREERENLRKEILKTKNFQLLYNKVIEHLQQQDQNPYIADTISDYVECFRRFDFSCVHHKLKLIDQDSLSVFVPLEIPIDALSKKELRLLEEFRVYSKDGVVDGGEVWQVYESIVSRSKAKELDFTQSRIALKQISSLLALFTFSFFANRAVHSLSTYGEERLGFFYMESWSNVYSLEEGLDLQAVADDFIL